MRPKGFRGMSALLLAFVHAAVSSPLSGATEQPAVTSQEQQSSSTLHYVSDYLSFVGHDTLGHVAFALDTNRGRDGDQYQAEHFVVLHDERQGWIDLVGNGFYDNATRKLFGIPDSPVFAFEGTPATGLTITSKPNSLTLTMPPLQKRISRKQDGGEYWMSSTQATLQWKGRTLGGRVIYEYLSKPDFNRLTRTYWKLWDDFQGFYLSLDGAGDFYLHRSDSEIMTTLIGKQEAFAVLDSNELALADLSITIHGRTFAPGFYRWPTRWNIGWQGEEGRAALRLETLHFNRIANWVIGGFAMSIVQGKLQYSGQSYPVYGFAELLM